MSGSFELHFPWWFTLATVLAFNLLLLFVWFAVLRWFGLTWLALAVVGLILAVCVIALGMPPADAGYELAGFVGLSAVTIGWSIRRRGRARTKGAGPRAPR